MKIDHYTERGNMLSVSGDDWGGPAFELELSTAQDGSPLLSVWASDDDTGDQSQDATCVLKGEDAIEAVLAIQAWAASL